ncbi:hypothetical protein QR680_005563 [Steinernema hermaphroditum]|uniref:Fucosyltransferase n=1 Tax=Steinernema hermaphroditum TaxID=289476 RepID=A0AA39HTS8_9BILA|nr:hypothetical protein QR680_005563 [Steinernema hermaphroditum]
MTYRSDSDYHVPYDRFEESGELYAPSFVEEAVSRKDVDVLMVVSKCHTPGKRELMIEEFRKLIDVRFLGACAKRNCDEHCLHESVMKARFYLSLENSVCPEYVTEKVFRMKELIVPLVFRKEDHEALLPKNSFIAIDQFRSLKDLVEHLRYLSANLTAYREYFEWTRRFGFRTNDYKSRAFCDLCGELHNENRPEKSYADIWEWWGAGRCDSRAFQRYLDSST